MKTYLDLPWLLSFSCQALTDFFHFGSILSPFESTFPLFRQNVAKYHVESDLVDSATFNHELWDF